MKISYLKTSLYTVFTITLLVCSSQNYAQQYYKWMDAHGSTHYTTTPPPKGAKHVNKVSVYGDNTQTTPAQTTKNTNTVVQPDHTQQNTQPNTVISPPSTQEQVSSTTPPAQ